MKDKLFNEIKQGQFVDVFLPASIYRAYVVEVTERVVVVPGQITQPPGVTLNVIIPMSSRDGVTVPCYVTAEPQPSIHEVPMVSETKQ